MHSRPPHSPDPTRRQREAVDPRAGVRRPPVHLADAGNRPGRRAWRTLRNHRRELGMSLKTGRLPETLPGAAVSTCTCWGRVDSWFSGVSFRILQAPARPAEKVLETPGS
jgi:hypothetical protein